MKKQKRHLFHITNKSKEIVTNSNFMENPADEAPVEWVAQGDDKATPELNPLADNDQDVIGLIHQIDGFDIFYGYLKFANNLTC